MYVRVCADSRPCHKTHFQARIRNSTFFWMIFFLKWRKICYVQTQEFLGILNNFWRGYGSTLTNIKNWYAYIQRRFCRAFSTDNCFLYLALMTWALYCIKDSFVSVQFYAFILFKNLSVRNQAQVWICFLFTKVRSSLLVSLPYCFDFVNCIWISVLHGTLQAMNIQEIFSC